LAVAGAEPLHLELLALLDSVLLPTGGDDGIHRGATLSVGAPLALLGAAVTSVRSRAAPGRPRDPCPRTRDSARSATRAAPRRCACGSSRPGPVRRCRTPGCGSCRGPAPPGTPG